MAEYVTMGPACRVRRAESEMRSYRAEGMTMGRKGRQLGGVLLFSRCQRITEMRKLEVILDQPFSFTLHTTSHQVLLIFYSEGYKRAVFLFPQIIKFYLLKNCK